MRKILVTTLAAVMATAPLLTFTATTSEAQPRYWRGDNRWHGSGFQQRWHGPRYGYRYGPRYYHRRHGPNWGAVAAGSIIGLAAGAAIAGSAGGSDSVAYCQQRFRSYDPASGTYLGYDGYRHACP